MFSDPEKNIGQFALREGMHVADFGAGSGHYSIAAAKKVGDTGTVFAIEVQKELLDRITEEATRQNVNNIKVLWGDIEHLKGTRLRDQSIDAVIVSNVLFQVEHKQGMIQEISRILVPGGMVLCIDWSESFGGLGPAPDHVVQQETAQKLFTDAGFTITQSIEPGAHHYGFIAVK